MIDLSEVSRHKLTQIRVDDYVFIRAKARLRVVPMQFHLPGFLGGHI